MFLINNIKPGFINHSTDSFIWSKKGWKSIFTGGGCGTRFGIFAFLAIFAFLGKFVLSMQICPSFQRSDEEPQVFIPNKIQLKGYTQQPACSPFSHWMSLTSLGVPWARPWAGDGVHINHGQCFLIWQCWCGATDK